MGKEKVLAALFSRGQQHATAAHSCKDSDYKAQDGSADVFIFSTKSSQVCTWERKFSFAGSVLTVAKCTLKEKTCFELWTSLVPVRVSLSCLICQSLAWRTQFRQSVAEWLIHPTLPGNVQTGQLSRGGGVSLHRDFSYLASSANTECINSPRCSVKIPRSSTRYFSHFGWAWTAALLQEQGTKLCHATASPASCLFACQREALRPNTTMLLICENREVNRRADGAGLKLLYSSVLFVSGYS